MFMLILCVLLCMCIMSMLSLYCFNDTFVLYLCNVLEVWILLYLYACRCYVMVTTV